MLESEMEKKACPEFSEGGVVVKCCTLGCAMWEEYTRSDPSNTPYGRLPMDPPMGDCGLKISNLEVEVV